MARVARGLGIKTVSVATLGQSLLWLGSASYILEVQVLTGDSTLRGDLTVLLVRDRRLESVNLRIGQLNLHVSGLTSFSRSSVPSGRRALWPFPGPPGSVLGPRRPRRVVHALVRVDRRGPHRAAPCLGRLCGGWSRLAVASLIFLFCLQA